MPTYTFYILHCKDPIILPVYIGVTSNLKQRLYDHKNITINPNRLSHNTPLYQFIRSHGGWNNWSIRFQFKKVCSNFQHAKLIEKHLIECFPNHLNSKKI